MICGDGGFGMAHGMLQLKTRGYGPDPMSQWNLQTGSLQQMQVQCQELGIGFPMIRTMLWLKFARFLILLIMQGWLMMFVDKQSACCVNMTDNSKKWSTNNRKRKRTPKLLVCVLFCHKRWWIRVESRNIVRDMSSLLWKHYQVWIYANTILSFWLDVLICKIMYFVTTLQLGFYHLYLYL